MLVRLQRVEISLNTIRIADTNLNMVLLFESGRGMVVVDAKDYAQVNEGDIVLVTWTSEVGGASYTIMLQDETAATRERIRSKLERLKNRDR